MRKPTRTELEESRNWWCMVAICGIVGTLLFGLAAIATSGSLDQKSKDLLKCEQSGEGTVIVSQGNYDASIAQMHKDIHDRYILDANNFCFARGGIKFFSNEENCIYACEFANGGYVNMETCDFEVEPA